MQCKITLTGSEIRLVVFHMTAVNGWKWSMPPKKWNVQKLTWWPFLRPKKQGDIKDKTLPDWWCDCLEMRQTGDWANPNWSDQQEWKVWKCVCKAFCFVFARRGYPSLSAAPPIQTKGLTVILHRITSWPVRACSQWALLIAPNGRSLTKEVYSKLLNNQTCPIFNLILFLLLLFGVHKEEFGIIFPWELTYPLI